MALLVASLAAQDSVESSSSPRSVPSLVLPLPRSHKLLATEPTRWPEFKSRKFKKLQAQKLSEGNAEVPLWPMPAEVAHGTAQMVVSPRLEFISLSGGQLPEIVLSAIDRYRALIFEDRPGLEPTAPHSPLLAALEIGISSPHENLSIGVDESYTLHVPYEGGPGARLEATTVYGVLRGLETFSQLIDFNFDSRSFIVESAPWVIADRPRFAHRGLLIDTSRHYQPVAVLEQVLESMAYAKLNVIHWHMVDQQAFPLEIPSFPGLWKGAHSPRERYTLADVARVVQFAADRGIVVVPEIDVPGHAASWGVGYPELWPSLDCKMPLDVSRNFTFHVIRGILRDLKSVIPYTTFHLGGDEVDMGCWLSSPRIQEWMSKHQMGPKEAYAHFVLRAAAIAREEGWETVVLWEETFANFGGRLDSSMIVENWFQRNIGPEAVASGQRVLMALVGEWYLDHSEHDWWSAYSLEPCAGLARPESCALVVGGEACMWTENVDPSNILARIWPRTASVAERLWSPLAHTNATAKEAAQDRLLQFKCALHRRGIGANYVTMGNWHEVFNPGSCYKTR